MYADMYANMYADMYADISMMVKHCDWSSVLKRWSNF